MKLSKGASKIAISLLILSFVVIFSFMAFQSLGNVFPTPGPSGYPAWVNGTDMFFADGNEIRILVNFTCSPPSRCNSSMNVYGNFSLVGGNSNITALFRSNSTASALFELIDTVNTTEAAIFTGSIIRITPRNITIIGYDGNGSIESFNTTYATVVLVNMSTVPGCPPEDMIATGQAFLPPFVPLLDGNPSGPIVGCSESCTSEDTAEQNATGDWLFCAPSFGGSTTNFTDIASTGNFSNIPFVMDAPGKCKLNFTTNVSMDTPDKASAIFEFAAKNVMSGGKIGVNDTEFNGNNGKPNLNLSARLTIYNAANRLGITSGHAPVISRSSYGANSFSGCPASICSGIVWDGTDITFGVSSFSEYQVSRGLGMLILTPSDGSFITNASLVGNGNIGRIVNFTFVPTWNATTNPMNVTIYVNTSGGWNPVAGYIISDNSTNSQLVGVVYNFTTDGSYKWNAVIFDIFNMSDTGTTNNTFTIDTLGPKPTTFVTSIVPAFQYNNASQFNVTWSDLNGVSYVIFESNISTLTPVGANYTMTPGTNGASFFSSVLGAGGYYWKTYANDSLGNWNVSVPIYFTINKASSTSGMTLTLDGDASSPQSRNFNNFTDIEGSESNYDDAGCSYLNKLNGNLAPLGVADLGAGAYNFTVFTDGCANYTAGQIEVLFNMIKSACNIDLFLNGVVADSDNSINYGTMPNATAVWNSSAGLTWELMINGTPWQYGGNYLGGLVDLAAGSYNFTANFSGAENFSSCSQENYLTIKKAAVNIVLGPTSQSVTYPNSLEQYCMVNTTDFACSFSRNGVDMTALNGSVPDLAVGTYVFNTTVSASTENYTYTNQNSTLTISIGTPSLTLAFDGAQGNATYYSNSIVLANANSSVTGLTVTMNSSLPGSTQLSNTTNVFGSVSLSNLNASYMVWANITGTVNYSAVSKTYWIKVLDNQPPQWSSMLSGNSSMVGGGTNQLNVTWTDYNVTNATLATNEGGTWHNITTTYGSVFTINSASGVSYFTWSNASVANGTAVAWAVYAMDKFGQQNVTSSATFTPYAADGDSCSASTECSGGYCCSNACQSTACTVAATSSSGGGGGGSVATTGKVIKTLASILPDITKIVGSLDLGATDTALTQIGLNFNTRATNVQLIVEKLDGQTSDVTINLPNKVYRYMTITLTNVNASIVEPSVIQFELSRSWLAANNISASKVVLYRWHDGAWNALTTTSAGSDVTYMYYQATTPGFSLFAISSSGAGQTTTTVPVTTTTVAPQTSTTEQQTPSTAPVTTTVSPGVSPIGKLQVWQIVALAVVLITGVVLVLMKMKIL